VHEAELLDALRPSPVTRPAISLVVLDQLNRPEVNRRAA
jgi:hypothetical protein